MGFLKEENVWPEQIYQIERSDPLMGGEFGVNNRQAVQLASRTLWLLERLLKEHNPDGTHKLDAGSLAEGARISESKLAISVPTDAMRRELEKLEAEISRCEKNINAIRAKEDSAYGAIFRALKLNWTLGFPRLAFELFAPEFSLRPEIPEIEILETVAGDDSIDVADSSSLEAGQELVLFDRKTGKSRFVSIRTVLTDRRAVLKDDLDITGKGGMTLAPTSFVRSDSGVFAPQGSMYASANIYALRNANCGRIAIIHRPGGRFRAEILREGEDAWEPSPLSSSSPVGRGSLVQSSYFAPGRVFKFRITALVDSGIDHIAVISEQPSLSASPVRTPQVVDSDFTISRYGALCREKHKATIFQICEDSDFGENSRFLEFGPDDNPDPVWDYKMRALGELGDSAPKTKIWWRARYMSEKNRYSGWSGCALYIPPAQNRA